MPLGIYENINALFFIIYIFINAHPHPQANFGCDSKKMVTYGLHLTILAIKGRGFIFRNRNTFELSASTTPTHKVYFCSQTLAVMVKTMGMYKWAPLNPI